MHQLGLRSVRATERCELTKASLACQCGWIPASHGCGCLDDVIQPQGEHGSTELAGNASIPQGHQSNAAIEAMTCAQRRFDLAMNSKTHGKQHSGSIRNGKAHR
jgi:hypothetical protein